GDYPFLKNASAAPPVATDFDYIIVGGGTAGCPLAATLSLNYSVLLLERGNTPYGNPDIESAANFGKLISNIQGNTWFSPVQSFQSQDGVFNRRARVLGGGSSINAGFYSRASDDYVSRAGWDAGMVASAYEWVESVVAFFPRLQQWQTAVRDALLEVGVGPDNGRTYKHASGTKVGGSIFDEAGKRHTAADLLQFANPNNITVLLFANVHRILFAPPVPRSPPRAIGTVFSDSLGIRHLAMLREPLKSQILLAAGAIGSPHFLMLSGVGDVDILEPYRVPVVLNSSSVGKGMTDNPANSMYVPSRIPVEISLMQTVGITDFGGFIETSSGIRAVLFQLESLVTTPPSLRSKNLLLKNIEELRNLPLETQRMLGQAGVIFQKVDVPASTGTLKICIHAPKLHECFPYSALNNTKLIGNVMPSEQDVKTLSEWCRNTVTTIWQYHGGCQVGRVVDAEYRVIGAHGLRVIDGSTFNSSPGTNPQATVMMLGRYMGVKILQERQLAA
uniref:Glucose-methanol-choline oxidoreductase N-terminal domain-containing protein n=1 Tax=Physcomitrium patens TaxID=3218 RepID=A0A7I4EHT4_PHYPA